MNSNDVQVKRIDGHDGITVQASCALMTDKTAQGLLLLAAPEVRNVKLRVTVDHGGGITAYVHIRLRQDKKQRLGGNFGDITRQITLGFTSDVTRVEGVTAKLLQRATRGKQAPGDALVVKTLPLLADLDADLDQCLQAALADHAVVVKEVAPLMAAKRAVASVRRTATEIDGTGRQVNALATHLAVTLARGGYTDAVLADLAQNTKLLRGMLDQLDQQCAAAATAIAVLPAGK